MATAGVYSMPYSEGRKVDTVGARVAAVMRLSWEVEVEGEERRRGGAKRDGMPL